GPHRLLARTHDLEQVEGAQAQFLERQRIGDTQRHQCKQKQDAHRPRYAETPCPARNALHAADTLQQFGARISIDYVSLSALEAFLAQGGPAAYFSRKARFNWSCS